MCADTSLCSNRYHSILNGVLALLQKASLLVEILENYSFTKALVLLLAYVFLKSIFQIKDTLSRRRTLLFCVDFKSLQRYYSLAYV